MTCRLDRLWLPGWLESRAVCVRFHKTYLTQIFGPTNIGPDGYPGRPMARPSAILERFWLQNYPSKWRQKVIEFWLRWNCDFCYPSHAKSLFSLSRTPPKMIQNRLKKRFCTQTPLKILNFQPQGASGWQHEPKRLPKGFLLRGPGAAQKHHFCCPKLSWGQDGPQESPSLDFGSSSTQFWTIFTCFRNLFLSTCFILVCTWCG